jgi:glucose-6-phosphate 1-epimerase
MWLVMLLEVENTGESEMTFEEALHSYFAVEDVREVLVRGLENTGYRDKVDGLASKMQGAEPLRFTGETDRIFESTAAKCEIEDGVTGRRITVNKSGSMTTVVWNPWIEKALKMKDFGDEEWRRMICVETANAGVNAVTIGPGKKHSIRVVISPGSLPS